MQRLDRIGLRGSGLAGLLDFGRFRDDVLLEGDVAFPLVLEPTVDLASEFLEACREVPRHLAVHRMVVAPFRPGLAQHLLDAAPIRMRPVVVGHVFVKGCDDRLALLQIERPSGRLFLEVDAAGLEGAFGAAVELLPEFPIPPRVAAAKLVPLRPERFHRLGLRVDVERLLRQFLHLAAKLLAPRPDGVGAPVAQFADAATDGQQIRVEGLRVGARQPFDEIAERAVLLDGFVYRAAFHAVPQHGETVGHRSADVGDQSVATCRGLTEGIHALAQPGERGRYRQVVRPGVPGDERFRGFALPVDVAAQRIDGLGIRRLDVRQVAVE